MLSNVLRQVRLSGSLQFCFMPQGAWQTDDKPAFANQAAVGAQPIPFHVVVDGACWLKIEGRHIDLMRGDVVAFPFGTGHQLGAGSGWLDDYPTKLAAAKTVARGADIASWHADGSGFACSAAICNATY